MQWWEWLTAPLGLLGTWAAARTVGLAPLAELILFKPLHMKLHSLRNLLDLWYLVSYMNMAQYLEVSLVGARWGEPEIVPWMLLVFLIVLLFGAATAFTVQRIAALQCLRPAKVNSKDHDS